jgi:hypothetical protein
LSIIVSEFLVGVQFIVVSVHPDRWLPGWVITGKWVVWTAGRWVVWTAGRWVVRNRRLLRSRERCVR